MQVTVKEEDRLAAVISEIDQNVRIVPRGAFVMTPTGEVYPNRSFEGTCSKCSLLPNVASDLLSQMYGFCRTTEKMAIFS